MIALIHIGLGMIICGLSVVSLFASGACCEGSEKDKETGKIWFCIGIALLSVSLASFYLAGAA
ncbi:hypothetical protein [Thalassobius sp. I31.1]|uniref:hypothetical protein n=1 Tax=Thalassobius sp. I31.1 TaxID=2109912 RepID=UPI000D19F19F|nr:hypothetical protein [Thalassobius sp. I31.1]